MTPINFTANYLKTTYLPRKTSETKYEPAEVSIVALDINDKKDVETLAKTAHEWETVASGFGYEIYNEALKPRLYPDIVAEHYLAITKQNQDYANLNSKDILGLALFSEKDDFYDEISWLQANPNTNKESSNPREFLGIGKKLVDFMKGISYKPIKVNADEKAVQFYEKQDFTPINEKYPSVMHFLREDN